MKEFINQFDEPTIISLYDTVYTLEKNNPNWLDDRSSRMIFAWQASLFLENHVEEVCKDKYPELMELCQEYRQYKTMMGLPISPLFGLEALEYVRPKDIEYSTERFGSYPIRECYFKIE